MVKKNKGRELVMNYEPINKEKKIWEPIKRAKKTSQ